MIILRGTYADECNGILPDRTLQYVCRVMRYRDYYHNPIGEKVDVKDEDVLLVCGKGTWFALFRETETDDEIIENLY